MKRPYIPLKGRLAVLREGSLVSNENGGYLYQIEMHKPSTEFARCWHAAASHIQSRVADCPISTNPNVGGSRTEELSAFQLSDGLVLKWTHGRANRRPGNTFVAHDSRLRFRSLNHV